MKYSWKNMKTKTKIGIISTIAYAATTLAIPAYAAVKQEINPAQAQAPVEVVNLENIKTAQDANNLFHEKLKEYCRDKILNLKEIENLNKICVKEKMFSEEVFSGMEKKYTDVKKEVEDLQKKITSLERNLALLNKQDFDFKNYLSGQKKKIGGLLKEEYPGILDKEDTKLNMIYPATVMIEGGNLETLIKETIQTIHDKISLEYDDKVLEPLLEKSEGLKLMDVAKLLRVIENYETNLSKSQNTSIVKEKKEKLEKEIEPLRLKSKNLQQKITEGEKIKEKFLAKQRSTENLEVFTNYITFRDNAKEFIGKFDDFNKYWSFSLIVYAIYNDDYGMEDYKPLLNENKRKTIETNMKQYLTLEGLEAEIETLKNPTKLKFPEWWCYIINCFAFPILRNLLIRAYMKPDDTWGYGGSAAAGFFNGVAGFLITDGLHPLAFWIRMGTPLLIQPIKRSGFFDDFP